MLCIVVIVVIITDISGFNTTLKSVIKWILTKGKFSNGDYSLKIVDCSLCQSWWLQLIYLLVVGEISIINIVIALLFAMFTINIKDILLLIRDTITKIINYIYDKLID